MQTLRFTQIALVCAALAASGCRSLSPVGELAEKAPIDAQPITLDSNEVRVTDHVVVITDASGTQYMNQTFPSAKALTQSFVKAMPDANVRAADSQGYDAGAVGFGGDDRNRVAVQAFNRAALAAQADSLEVMGAVDGMGGTTPLHRVFTELTPTLAQKRGRAALVIFSDGLPDDPAATLANAKALAQARQDETCFHAVQTGNTQEGHAFLKELTSLTSCGSLRSEADVTSGFEVQQLAKNVFLGPAAAPVASAGPCDGVVRLRGIEFAFDRAEIVDASKPVLDVAVEQLSRCPEIRVTVSGHTDSIGSDSYNNELSQRRAEATKRYFVQQGVPAARLETEGFGESQPVASNDDAAGRARNRRVELTPLR